MDGFGRSNYLNNYYYDKVLKVLWKFTANKSNIDEMKTW